jgi:tetratricopeptide (TPR) repeat protein
MSIERVFPSAGAPGAGTSARPPDDVDDGDEVAAVFFAELRASRKEDAIEVVEEAPRHAPAERSAAAHERRRRFMRVVAGVVALSGAIFVAGAVRVVATRAAPTNPPVQTRSRFVAVAHAVEPPAALSSRAQPSSIVESPSAEPAGRADAGPVGEATEAVAKTNPVAAREAKRTSQRALERGDVARSIQLGERSVALDPADAEAWLVLGAAYELRGAYAEARRCFAACVRLSTRGPRGECAALFH